MGRGVTCHQCGASTPLPDDLRNPVFACAFCRAELRTIAYAGSAAVSADALVAHVGAAMRGEMAPADAARAAPRFHGGDTSSRAATCQHCQSPIAVPLDLVARELTCSGCGRTQPVNQYISDRERFELDMQRQVAGNEALARLRAEGVQCTRCGGNNRVPADGSVQLACAFCRATILLADHVDASAVARARLKHNVFALRDEAIRQQTERARTVNRLVIAGVVLVVILMLVAGILSSRH